MATYVLMTLFLASSVLTLVPSVHTIDYSMVTTNTVQQTTVSQSLVNMTIPYVDAHYGFADGIIDPKEYATEYTDPATGVTIYIEHNSTVLFVGLEATTSGYIGIGWKNYTADYNTDGLNESDLIIGYAPGTPHADIDRVTLDDSVTVHYELFTRDGELVQEGNVPRDDSGTLASESLLKAYKDEIVGMRIGEVRHLIIPAEDAYNQPGHLFYGKDLEYIMTLTRINDDFSNPADASEIVYSEEHGVSTFRHNADVNQSQVLAADASDDGSVTQIEYFIQLNSTDIEDIPLLNMTDVRYPMVVMFGATEDIDSLPVQHTDWSNPIMAELTPNTAPSLFVESPAPGATLTWVANLALNVTDNTWIRKASFRVDDENWTDMEFDFRSQHWNASVDLTTYETGDYTIWFNATDPSQVWTITSVNVSIYWPFTPLRGMNLRVDRTFSTERYHLDEIRDEYRIRNNGSAPINAIEIVLPQQWTVYFLSISAVDNGDNELEVVRLADIDSMYAWRVHFFQPVEYGQTYRFTTTMNMHSLHTIKDFDENIYSIDFLKYPILPYVISNATLTVEFRSGDTIVGNRPDTTDINIQPMTTDEFYVEMKSFTPDIIAERLTIVTVDPWGWMTYRETVTVENVGPARETSFSMELPAYATSFKVYDTVGILAASQNTLSEYDFNESASLRIDLTNDRFGSDGLWPGYSYKFNIDYVVQVVSYQSSAAGGNLLEIPIAHLYNMKVTTHVIEVVMTQAIDVVQTSGNYRLIYGVFDNRLRYTIYNTTQFNVPQIELVYQISLLTATRPLIFALIIGIIAAVYVSYKRVRAIEGEADQPEGVSISTDSRTKGATPELLREFATLYSRRTTINMDLEKLEASRRRGKVKKREFLIREKDLKQQLDDVDSSLPDVKERLISYGPRYRDMIAQLELENEKIEGAKAGLRQLLLRKKKQRISRVAFDRSRDDYLKTIKRATSAVDRILLSIQEEAGDV